MMKLAYFLTFFCAMIGCASLQANCWDNFYVEAGGGFAVGLSKAKDHIGVGVKTGNHNGMATNAQILPGGFFEAKLGYRCMPCIRFDLSYTYFTARYNWQEVFGVNGDFLSAPTSVFNSDLDSHIALFNTYLQLDQLCDSNACWCANPYIMGGVGACWNNLHHIRQFNSPVVAAPSVQLAELEAHTATNFAGRFGLGVLVRLSCLIFDVAARTTYINTVRTGNTRVITSTFGGQGALGDYQPIFDTELRNNWLWDFHVGIIYPF